MLSVEGLFTEYPNERGEIVKAAQDVSFTVAEGQLYTLLGPSGCGKTTTLRSIAGLERPRAGEISVNGQVVFSSARGVFVAPNRRGFGMVFQSYAIWPHMTVFENAAFPLQVRGAASFLTGRPGPSAFAKATADRRSFSGGWFGPGGGRTRLSRSAIRDRVMRVLDAVQLGELAERQATKLSGGQQQRLALARALVMEPALLLLDEPLSNLDAKLRERMRFELKRLQRDLKITTVYVTHDQEEALAMADRIAVMDQGQVAQIGTGQEIYRAPNSRYVADFIGEANLIDCAVRDKRLYVDGAVLPYDAVAAGERATLMIRPEDIHLGEPPAGGGAASLRAVVRDKVFLGSAWRIYAALPTGQEVAAQTASGEAVDRAAKGEAITLWWPRDRGRVLAQ